MSVKPLIEILKEALAELEEKTDADAHLEDAYPTLLGYDQAFEIREGNRYEECVVISIMDRLSVESTKVRELVTRMTAGGEDPRAAKINLYERLWNALKKKQRKKVREFCDTYLHDIIDANTEELQRVSARYQGKVTPAVRFFIEQAFPDEDQRCKEFKQALYDVYDRKIYEARKALFEFMRSAAQKKSD